VLDLAQSGPTEVSIYNVRGQKVRTLMKADVSRGTFAMKWDGCDEHGQEVASGRYFVKMAFRDNVLCKKLLLVN
jgi:flagellar hook assembly protein FlgD